MFGSASCCRVKVLVAGRAQPAHIEALAVVVMVGERVLWVTTYLTRLGD